MPKYKVEMVMENQKTSVLPIPNANNWIYKALILGMTSFDHRKGNDLMPGGISQGGNIKISRGKVPWNVLALDSGASVNILINGDYITNMKEAERPITIHCGGKSWEETQTGDLNEDLCNLSLNKTGYYFNENGVANLLSLSK